MKGKTVLPQIPEFLTVNPFTTTKWVSIFFISSISNYFLVVYHDRELNSLSIDLLNIFISIFWDRFLRALTCDFWGLK